MDSNKTEPLEKISTPTDRMMRLWLKGRAQDLKVYRIPIQYLYFNIENGRYADKMMQLKSDNPAADIDPKLENWKAEIYKMLKGEYQGNLGLEGTEEDKSAFERLREDIEKRDQLNPGIVLSDGGVIDGNRRLAVLISLNSPRFHYFDGVILPEDTSAEDRWRIEVGVQLGKDQKLDYSPINKLLKIRQGMELFKSMRLPSGKTPEAMVADALYGVTLKEIRDSVAQLLLIEEYLDFFKMRGQYHRVADQGERIIEAVNALRAAERLSPHEKAKLKVLLFIIIRESIMSNWKIREIKNALGGDPKGRGRKIAPIKKAINHLLIHSTDPKMAREAYLSNIQARMVDKTKTICKEFQDIYEAEKSASQPLYLAKEARTKLEVLRDALKEFKKDEDKTEIFEELVKTKKIIKACFGLIKISKPHKS
jgi:hypothetical protein